MITRVFGGLVGSFETEKITLYKKLPQMARHGTLSWKYPCPASLCDQELDEFYKDTYQNRIQDPGLNDVKKTLELINKTYKRSNCDFSS